MSEATKLLQDLVSLPSVNPMGRELPEDILYEHRVTDYLETFFRSLGVPCERQKLAPKRENILAFCQVPGAKRTLMLEAHQDTVPIDNMIVKPFAAAIENGKLFGRGACDIKGGMASMLATFARVARQKPKGACNLIMACSVDEEHTFTGIKEIVRQKVKADLAVVAEPTQLNIVHAHKGVVRWHVTTRGRSCHSSSPAQIAIQFALVPTYEGSERFPLPSLEGIQEFLIGLRYWEIGKFHRTSPFSTRLGTSWFECP